MRALHLFTLAAAAVFLCSCSDDSESGAPPCDASGPLELRAFTGDAVNGSVFTFEPGQSYQDSNMFDRTTARVSGNVVHLVFDYPPAGGEFRFVDLTLANGVPTNAVAATDSVSDIDTGDRTCYRVAATGGWIMPQEASLTGRNRGRFELVFPKYTVRGTYDTAPKECGGAQALSCGADEWCDFRKADSEYPCGTGGNPGLCQPRPTGCPADGEAVCACDGVVYDNACLAHQAGADDRPKSASCTKP